MVLRPAAAFSYLLKAFVAVLKMNMEISPVFKHLEYDIPVRSEEHTSELQSR